MVVTSEVPNEDLRMILNDRYVKVRFLYDTMIPVAMVRDNDLICNYRVCGQACIVGKAFH